MIGKHVPSFSRTAMGSVFRDRCVWSSLTTQRFWVCAWRCTKSAAMSCLAPGVTSMDDSLSRSQSSPALMLMEGGTNAASSASEPRFGFAVFPVVFARSARSVIFVSASSSSSPSSSFSSSSLSQSPPASPSSPPTTTPFLLPQTCLAMSSISSQNDKCRLRASPCRACGAMA